MFASLREGGGPREWWKEPAAVEGAKMQSVSLRIVCVTAMSARDSSLTLENDTGGMGHWLAQCLSLWERWHAERDGEGHLLAHFGGSEPPPYERGGGTLHLLARFGGSEPPPYERIALLVPNARSAYHCQRQYHAQSAYHARSAYHCAKRPRPHSCTKCISPPEAISRAKRISCTKCISLRAAPLPLSFCKLFVTFFRV